MAAQSQFVSVEALRSLCTHGRVCACVPVFCERVDTVTLIKSRKVKRQWVLCRRLREDSAMRTSVL